jgi:hypothetical protein
MKVTKIYSEERPKLWPNNWILHHDIALAYHALRVSKLLAEKSTANMFHLPYSPDLASCIIWLFPKLANAMK